MLYEPERAATDLWQHLITQQPAVAAALAMQLRDLPDDWPQRLLGVGRVDTALALPPSAPDDGGGLEFAPYSAHPEDCAACGDTSGLCRYHEGVDDGYDALHRPLLDAVRHDPEISARAALHALTGRDEAAAGLQP